MSTTNLSRAGLSTAEAGARLAADGPNAVAAPRRRRLAARVGHQLTDPLVALLLAAAVVTAVLGDLPDTAVIVLVVTLNTVIGVAQEVRADAAIAALGELTAPSARVVRDGQDRMVAAASLVRGDFVRLEPGDVVPADLDLVVAHRASFDESALTGESVPVHRAPGEEAGAGTVLTAGRAAGTVVRTGAASRLGRIAVLVAGSRPAPTPLQRRLAGLGRVLGAAAVVVSLFVFALGLLGGQPVVRMAITAVSLVVAAVPESLPAVVTLALALGARRMARAHAIPRRLQAVETLGSVTVIASDKTGTLTENRMSVRHAVTAGGAGYDVTGTGYAPYGEVRPAADDRLRQLARAALLCNDASLVAPTGARSTEDWSTAAGVNATAGASAPAGESAIGGGRLPGREKAGREKARSPVQKPPDSDAAWAAVGDPMEAALLAFAGRCGLDAAAERARAPRVREQPFDQGTRRMTTVHRRPGDRYLVVCKGAPEAVLTAGRDDRLLVEAATLAAGGLRVLALATADTDDPNGDPPLAPVGLVAIGDPLRPGAAPTAQAFERSGVRLLLITGDHPDTAAAIGAQLGLLADGDRVARGDAGPLGPDDLAQARVYARTRPEQKLDIVTALQRRGEVVAMTGDGVNDAPALRRADIGVAMGGGTEVARQAADLVLADDNLATVAAAIGEGRRIYDNIRRFLRYALSGGIAELIVMLAGPLLGMPLALLPGQLLWINLLTHGVPGVALGAEPADSGVLDRRPRSPRESVLGDGLLGSVLAGGLCVSVAVLAAGVWALRADRPWQSVMFVVLGLAQLGVALAVRARPAPGTARNWSLLAAVAASGILQVGGVLTGPLRVLLGTEPLTVPELLACATIAALPGAALWLLRRGRA